MYQVGVLYVRDGMAQVELKRGQSVQGAQFQTFLSSLSENGGILWERAREMRAFS